MYEAVEVFVCKGFGYLASFNLYPVQGVQNFRVVSASI